MNFLRLELNLKKSRNLYLVAYYHIKPKNPNRTKEAGYMKDPTNFDYEESINITRGLKTRDSTTAKVILDLTEQNVVSNKFNDNRDFPSLLAHFQEGYPKYLNPLLAQLYSEQLNDVDVQSEEKKA